MNNDTKRTENIAAITAAFHRDPRYLVWVHRFDKDFDGWIAVIQYTIEIGECMTAVENEDHVDFDGCWYDSIDAVVNGVYTESFKNGSPPKGNPLKELVRLTILSHINANLIDIATAGPIAPAKPYYIAECDATDSDDSFFLLDDDYWTAMSRLSYCTARHFEQIQDAIDAVRDNPPMDATCVIFNRIEPDGAMNQVANMFPPTAEGKVSFHANF